MSVRREYRLLRGADKLGLKHCSQDEPCTNLLKSTLVKCAPMMATVSFPQIPPRHAGGTHKMRLCGLGLSRG